MCLYKVSWTPLTPINVSGAKEKITNKSKNSTHVAICFIKNDEEILLNSPYSSDWCLCIESYRWANYHCENVYFFNEKSMRNAVSRSVYLGFLNVTNSLLLDLVSTISSVWTPGHHDNHDNNHSHSESSSLWTQGGWGGDFGRNMSTLKRNFSEVLHG